VAQGRRDDVERRHHLAANRYIVDAIAGAVLAATCRFAVRCGPGGVTGRATVRS